jgi:murein DD-endopeptidase MepM/ murein hydrolase activator NlpD
LLSLLKTKKKGIGVSALSAAVLAPLAIMLSLMPTTVVAGSAVAVDSKVETAACIQLEGTLQQGGFVWGKVVPGSSVQLDGESLDVLADGTTFAGFNRDAAATAILVVSGEQECRQTLQIASREYNIQRVEGVPAKTVNPPKEQLERIRREGALVASARAPSLDRSDILATVLAGFVWPVEGPISGVYGSQRFYNGKAGRPHYGVDVAVPTGTAVHAPAAGIVTLAEPDLFYSGGTVILDHGYKLSSTFLHMSEVHVKVGDELKAGDLIGSVGATGRATGPHLDWRMNWRAQRIDPQLLSPAMPKP